MSWASAPEGKFFQTAPLSGASAVDPDPSVSHFDINPLTELIDMMGATRAYTLSGAAVQAEKGMNQN
jgi:flagellar basal body rod protein FlgC